MPDDQGDGQATARRRRYVRASVPLPFVSLTPAKVRLLRFLAECRFLSLPQLARLVCPSERADLSEKSARRHMRGLFDAGLVDVLPVSRLALAAPDAPNDSTLLYGSAPNLYVPTARGLDALYQTGVIGKDQAKRAAPSYGPKNSLFLAHELMVRDVRVWLEASAQASAGTQSVLEWRDGSDAAISLEGDSPTRQVKPDAWFVYGLRPEPHKLVLVGLVEVDRGTERGDRRWQEKLEAYAALFSGGALQEATGYRNARVLVITSDARRRDQLTSFIKNKGGAIAARFWLTEQTTLDTPSMTQVLWRQGIGNGLRPLLPG